MALSWPVIFFSASSSFIRAANVAAAAAACYCCCHWLWSRLLLEKFCLCLLSFLPVLSPLWEIGLWRLSLTSGHGHRRTAAPTQIWLHGCSTGVLRKARCEARWDTKFRQCNQVRALIMCTNWNITPFTVTGSQAHQQRTRNVVVGECVFVVASWRQRMDKMN